LREIGKARRATCSFTVGSEERLALLMAALLVQLIFGIDATDAERLTRRASLVYGLPPFQRPFAA
jgi:hypothetical protein